MEEVMKRNIIPYNDEALLFIAKRFATGDEYLKKDTRESVRCLRRILRHGSEEAKWEAWKFIDSGAVGNRLGFLLRRFWILAERGRDLKEGAPLVFGISFRDDLPPLLADALLKSRTALYLIELLVVITLIIDKI